MDSSEEMYRPLTIGVIGAGFVAAEHVSAWKHLGVDLRLAGGDATELGQSAGVQVAASVESLIDEVDVVDLCVPTGAHATLALQAAARGRHVISEKPLSISAAEAKRVVDAVHEAGARLFVGQLVRYFPEYEAAAKAVRDGAVGDVAVIRLARESFLPDRPASHWLFDEAESGGVIGDLMSHDIDYAISLAGPVARVYARTVRAVSDHLDDHAIALLTHRNGALTHLAASWAHVAPRFRTRFDIAGSAGLLTHDSDSVRTFDPVLRRPTQTADIEVGFPSESLSAPESNPFVNQFRDFVHAIETGGPARVDPTDAIHVAAVIEAALQSSRTRRAVNVQAGEST